MSADDRRVIGPYTLLERIGSGGFGDVYLAEQTQPVRRRVALKVLKRGMDTRTVLARFDAEAQALAMMDHPNIAKVFDAGETEDGLPYFALEYVPGASITDYCDRNRLTTGQRLQLFVPVCRAVQHAHSKGIIHRDLKPSNILVTEVDGETVPKVIDFGIAKAMEAPLTDRTMYTMYDGRIMGTPAYMSPEQLAGVGDIDTRSDVYSLGVILYEVLTGVLPIDPGRSSATGHAELRQQMRDEDPVAPSSRIRPGDSRTRGLSVSRGTEPALLRRQLRGEVDWIILKALETERTRRYETASALAADINRKLEGEAVEAVPPSASYRFGKFVRRHKLAVGSAAAIFLGVLIAAGGLVYALVDSNRQRALVEAALTQTQEARAAAEAVTAFVTGMLGAADPGEQGREVTVVEVLDRAAARIPEDLGDRPAVEARVRHTLGETYFALAQFDSAVEQLTRAVELNTEVLGDSDAATATTQRSLASAYRDLGELEVAESRLRDLLALETSIGAGEERLAHTLDQLGTVLILQGRYPEAEQFQARADAAARVAFGDSDPRRAEILANLGVLRRLLGDFDEAREALSEALAVLSREYGAENPQAMATAANLAIVYYQLGDYDEAIRYTSELADTQASVLGEEHASTLQTRNDLAAMYNASGRHAEAQAISLPVLEARRRLLGPEHPSTLQSLNNVAAIYRELGQVEKAEALLRESLEIKVRVLGEDHLDTIITRGNLGGLLTRTGRAEAALPVLQAALSSAERALPEDHIHRNNVRRKLGQCLYELGRTEEAEEVLLAAYAALAAKAGADHVYTRSTAETLAALYDEAGQVEAAAAWREKS
ncbi:MAG: tetratricopeptide repeat protein [Gammaproteobacteria bacterium]